MTLTLGNDLTGLVSREVAASGNKASGLGVSLTTGNDVFVEVVDEFLGNSLRDGEILLGAIAKNTTYGVNLLTVTNEYLKRYWTDLSRQIFTNFVSPFICFVKQHFLSNHHKHSSVFYNQYSNEIFDYYTYPYIC